MGPPEIKTSNNQHMADNINIQEKGDQKFVYQPGDSSGMLLRHSMEGPVL